MEILQTKGPKMAQTYQPSDALVNSVIAGIATPLPFVAGKLVKNIPGNAAVMRLALSQTIPLSLAAIASMREVGTRVALMSHGELTQEAEQGILRKIAAWFTPSEFTDVVKALKEDLLRLAREGYAQDAWKLEATESELVLVVLKPSFVKVSVDTVAEVFISSFEILKGFRSKLPF